MAVGLTDTPILLLGALPVVKSELVQEVAFAEDQVRVAVLPLTMVVGVAVKVEMVGVGAMVTVYTLSPETLKLVLYAFAQNDFVPTDDH